MCGHSVCVCLFTSNCCVCVHLDGLNAEHILGHTSRPFLSFLFKNGKYIYIYLFFIKKTQKNVCNPFSLPRHQKLKRGQMPCSLNYDANGTFWHDYIDKVVTLFLSIACLFLLSSECYLHSFIFFHIMEVSEDQQLEL